MGAGDEAVMAEQAFVVYQLIVQAVGRQEQRKCRSATTPMI